MSILKLECCKKYTISDSHNSNINEGNIYPSVKKPQVITLYTTGVDEVFILSKYSEASMSIKPDKEFLRLFFVSTASTGTTQRGGLWKVPKTPRADAQNKYTEIS